MPYPPSRTGHGNGGARGQKDEGEGPGPAGSQEGGPVDHLRGYLQEDRLQPPAAHEAGQGLAERGRQAALGHGNSGRPPSTAATGAELEFMRELKRPCPHITVAQFRDIFFEDALENPERAGDVERCGPRPRGASWFRGPFAREGWASPASRPARSCGGRVSHPMRDPLLALM